MANARRPSRWLTYLLVVLCLAAIAVAVVIVGPAGSPGATTTERDVQAQRGVVQSTVSGSGNLEPAKQLDLDFGVDGTVTKVSVEPGDEVASGDVLARLDDSDAKVALSEARAQLAEAEADLEAAQQGSTQAASSDTGAATASSGATANVAAAGGDQGSVETTMVAFRASAATVAVSASATPTETTPQEPAPTVTTTTPQATTPQTTTTQATTPQTTTAPAPSATSQGTTDTTPQTNGTPGSQSASGGTGAPTSSGAPSGSSGGSASAGAASQTQAQRDASIASAQAAVQKAKLAVEAAQQDLEDTRLRAPTRGTVAAVSGEVGDAVTAGSGGSGSGSGSSQAAAGSADSSGTTSGSTNTGFITLVNLRRMQMTVSFTEADITKVEVGQAATVSLSALENVHLAGHVTSVAVLGDTSGDVVSYPVTILLDQNAKDAKAGMSATAEVVVAQASGVTVPSQAVTGRGSTGTVLVRQDGEVQSQRVTVGLQGDTSTQILSGLKAGDDVVIRSTPVTGSAGGTSLGQGAQSGRLGGAGGLGGGGFSGGGFPSGGRFPAGGRPGG